MQPKIQQKKKIILFEGWRYLLHSYSIVMNYQIINIDKDKYTIYARETKYYKPWTPDKTFSKWPKKYSKILKEIKELPSDITPDLIYRVQYPYNIEPDPIFKNVPTIVFYTAEFSNLTIDYFAGKYSSLDEIIKKIKSSNIFMTGPSKWSINSLKSLGLPDTKNKLIPHGIDRSMIISSEFYRNYYREQFGILETDIMLLNTGAMTPNKGIEIILYTITKLYNNGHTNYKLFLKGSDTLYESKIYINLLFEDLVKNGHVDENILDTLIEKGIIIYCGDSLPFSDNSKLSIYGLYNMADYYISPYLGEGFNLPVLEALSTGLKTLIPKTGPTADFMDDFKDTIIQLNSEVISINGMLQNKIDMNECYNKLIPSEKYSWKNITNTLDTNYFEMLL